MKKFLVTICMVGMALLGAGRVAATGTTVDINYDNDTISEWKERCTGQDVPTFLGMRPWYYGLKMKASTNAVDNSDMCDVDEENFYKDNMETTVKTILVTAIYDMTLIVGILAMGFLIYAGFQYVYSGGDAAKAAKGRKTITSAIVGLVISVLGNAIVNLVGVALLDENAMNPDVGIKGSTAAHLTLYSLDPQTMIPNIINVAMAAVAVVSVGFMIYSGVIMMTSYGDVNKTAKGRKGIIYSIAGLLVSMLAVALTNFVIEILKKSMDDGTGGTNANLFVIVNNIFGAITAIAGLLSVVGIVIGGINYMIASGDASKVQKAKHTIQYSLIGLVVTLIGGTAISFIINAVFGS